MRYTIRGLTEQVITINSLNITIRGTYKDTLKYPHSIARGIEVSTEDQMADLRSLSNLGLISVESEQKVEPKPVPKAEQKVEKVKVTAKSKAKVSKKGVIKLVKDRGEAFQMKTPDNEDVVTMVSGEGRIQKGKMGKTQPRDFGNDPEITRASLEAARLIDEEEEKPPYMVDESQIAESEKMGSEAVIATGGKMSSAKVKMKRSVIPESKLTSQINWIDPEADNKKADVHNAFIDNPSDPDEKSDSFIE